MKNLCLLIPFLCIACSASPKSVGAKAGKLTCESMVLLKKAVTGDSSAKTEAEKLKKQAEELKKQFDSFDEEGRKEATNAMLEESKKCMFK